MPTVSQFLIERLNNAGVKHVFGVPGQYIAGFFQQICKSPMALISTADEAGAGFAADAYARIAGVGAVAVTYNTGAFKLINTVACAAAERSPLVIISGAPGVKERAENPVFQHMEKMFACQKDIFSSLCCDTAILTDPAQAGFEIDRVLESAKFYKLPVYIELPRDIADKAITYDAYRLGTPEPPTSDPENLAEAIEEVAEWMNLAIRPVILMGVEVARFELGVQFQKFADKLNIPMATTLLSKSVISEKHPLYLGLYNGPASQAGVQEAVENSDCLLMIGVMAGDEALIHMPNEFQRKNVVSCTVEELRIKHHAYKKVQFGDFVHKLLRVNLTRKDTWVSSHLEKEKVVFVSQDREKITTQRLFEKINSILDANSTVLADVGNALYGASQLMLHHNHAFLGHALYGTMGGAIPGALGANLARLHSRPIVVVGDGSFQQSMNELGTIVANRLKPIVFVLNNHGYATERMMVKASFNSINEWKYHRVVDMVGGESAEVSNEGELERAVAQALVCETLFVINVNLEADDNAPLLKMMSGLVKKS